jgi:hypothetical protein
MEATPAQSKPGNAGDREWVSGFWNPWDILLLVFLLFWTFAAIDAVAGFVESPMKRGEFGLLLGFSCYVLVFYGIRLAIPARRVTVHVDGTVTFRRRSRRLDVPPGALISMRKIWGYWWGGPRVKVIATTGRISYRPPSKGGDELLAEIASANPRAWLYVPKYRQLRRTQRGPTGWYADSRNPSTEWFWDGWKYTQSRSVTSSGATGSANEE